MTDADPDAAHQARALLLDLLGVPFLAFTLNLPEGEVTDRVGGTSAPLEGDLKLAVETLISFISSADHPDTSQGSQFRWQTQLEVLTRRPEGKLGVAIWLRSALGGSVEVPNVAGEHRKLLLEFARDVYPIFLVPKRAGGFFDAMTPSITMTIINHPAAKAFEAAVSKHTALSKLFPSTDPVGGVGYVVNNLGRGATLQQTLFPEILIKAGWRLACLDYQTPTFEQFCDGVLQAEGMVSKAAAGKTATVPVRIGIAGLPGDHEVEMPWGKLRPFCDRDRYLVPPSLDQQLSHTNVAGKQITINYRGDLVLEMELPYRLQISPWDQKNPPNVTEPASDMRDYEMLQHRVQSMQLGLLLGVPSNPRPTILMAWSNTFDPLSIGIGTGWRDASQMRGLLPTKLTKGQVAAWSKWTALVDEKRTSSINVAIGRTLAAATEQRSPDDALLDAVIAWENLVGSDDGETTFRITTSLAWLLTPKAGEREALVKMLRELYDLRSRIVHGNAKMSIQDIGAKHQEALDVTIKALRMLFERRPDLLGVNSATRSRRLTLGVKPPAALAPPDSG